MRLACLNHAASVQAEPGSNSSIVFLGPQRSSCPPHITLRQRERDLTVSQCGLSSKKNLSTDRPQTKHPEFSDRLLLPRRRLRRQGQSNTLQPTRTSPVNQKAFDARLKTSFWPSRARTRDDSYSNKMTFRRRQASIGRDHFLACTAKTF